VESKKIMDMFPAIRAGVNQAKKKGQVLKEGGVLGRRLGETERSDHQKIKGGRPSRSVEMKKGLISQEMRPM